MAITIEMLEMAPTRTPVRVFTRSPRSDSGVIEEKEDVDFGIDHMEIFSGQGGSTGCDVGPCQVCPPVLLITIVHGATVFVS